MITICAIAASFVIGFLIGCHIGIKAAMRHFTKTMDEAFGTN